MKAFAVAGARRDGAILFPVAMSAASASWSESETDTDVPVELVLQVRAQNPATRLGRRNRVKAIVHAEEGWYKKRGGRRWLDKRSRHGELEWEVPGWCPFGSCCQCVCSLFKFFFVWEGLYAVCASPICEHLFDPRAHPLASVCVTMCPRVVVYPSWR